MPRWQLGNGIMGDTNRNISFAAFIVKQFPNVKSVLVVADGEGELSKEIANYGLAVRVIEAKPRMKKSHVNVKYTKGWFTSDTKIDEDLIVGMHPDEATGEILLGAKKQNKSYAVVPCCSVGRYAENIEYTDWIKKLVGIFRCEQYHLNIKGRNIVLYDKKTGM